MPHAEQREVFADLIDAYVRATQPSLEGKQQKVNRAHNRRYRGQKPPKGKPYLAYRPLNIARLASVSDFTLQHGESWNGRGEAEYSYIFIGYWRRLYYFLNLTKLN